MRVRGRTAIIAALAGLMAVAACTDAEEPASSAPATTSTTRIVLDLEPATGAAITLGDGIDQGRRDALGEWVAGLRAGAELVRGLRFLDEPEVLLLAADEFAVAWERHQQPALDPTALAIDTRFLQLIGALAPGQSLRVLIEPAFEQPPVAYFDGDRRQTVILVPDGEPTSEHDVAVVGAIVASLADQYHQHADRLTQLAADGLTDEATALGALVQADATYFARVYAQEAGVGEQQAALGPVALATTVPGPVAATLAFPFQEAFAFVQELVDRGGIAAVDQAYGGADLTTERLLHPERIDAIDPIEEVGPSPLALTGYRLHRTGTLGELGLRALVGHTQTPGLVRQVLDGWGGDHFAVFTSGNNVAWVYQYRGDDVEDAVEVAQAFLDMAENSMGLSEPIAAGGGVEFIGRAIENEQTADDEAEEAVTGPYVFVDRVGAGLVVVVADETTAGRELVRSSEAS